jgi:hypothetical protein
MATVIYPHKTTKPELSEDKYVSSCSRCDWISRNPDEQQTKDDSDKHMKDNSREAGHAVQVADNTYEGEDQLYGGEYVTKCIEEDCDWGFTGTKDEVWEKAREHHGL